MDSLQPVFDAMLMSCAYCKHFRCMSPDACYHCQLRNNLIKVVDELIDEKVLDAFKLLPFEN